MYVLIIIKALFFFLPAYLANAAPVLLAKLNVFRELAVPVDLGKKIGKNFIFGDTKTYRGIVGGIAAGVFTALAQYLIFSYLPQSHYLYLFNYGFIDSILLGTLMGLGEGLGDLIKSFIKRRIGFKSSSACFPLDQMSFLGALFLSFLIYLPPFEYILAILIMSPAIPVLANLIAYKLGWKKVWW